MVFWHTHFSLNKYCTPCNLKIARVNIAILIKFLLCNPVRKVLRLNFSMPFCNTLSITYDLFSSIVSELRQRSQKCKESQNKAFFVLRNNGNASVFECSGSYNCSFHLVLKMLHHVDFFFICFVLFCTCCSRLIKKKVIIIKIPVLGDLAIHSWLPWQQQVPEYWGCDLYKKKPPHVWGENSECEKAALVHVRFVLTGT